MKQTQRKFFTVKFKDVQEGNYLIKLLEENGYTNGHHINSCEGLRVNVLIISEDTFWTTNITCLAAASSGNPNFKKSLLSVEEFIDIEGIKPLNL